MTIDHQRIWNETKDYIFITLGIIIYAFSWAFFLVLQVCRPLFSMQRASR